jgi:hypothetical protein
MLIEAASGVWCIFMKKRGVGLEGSSREFGGVLYCIFTISFL